MPQQGICYPSPSVKFREQVFMDDVVVKKQKSSIDYLIFIAAIATPIMTLPQVYAIWIDHSRGASIVTWASYVLIAFIWLAYGIKYRDKPIMIMQSLCIVTYSSIVVGLTR
jgi:MtN3 and saliva related transmembrane protein